jgi:hypothetical protein
MLIGVSYSRNIQWISLSHVAVDGKLCFVHIMLFLMSLSVAQLAHIFITLFTSYKGNLAYVCQSLPLRDMLETVLKSVKYLQRDIVEIS